MSAALMIQYCCIKPGAWGLVLPALSSMKHMQSPAVAWLCRRAFGVQILLHITQNYKALCLSSVGNAGSAPDAPAWMFGFTAKLPRD